MREYPLDPVPVEPQSRRKRTRMRSSGGGGSVTRAIATGILWLLDRRRRHRDLSHFLESMLLIIVGVSMVAMAAITDTYLHRGVETGIIQPYVIQPSGRELSTNADLLGLTPEQLNSVVGTLDNSGYGFVRHEVSWAEIERTQGQFDWSAYDAVFGALEDRGIGVIAVIVDSPEWSWPGTLVESTVQPPADPAHLETFSQELTSRYVGSVQFVQVWEQPNLASRWGGVPANGASFRPYLSAAFYGARAGNPEVRVVLPQAAVFSDVAEGPSDLEFLQSLYDAGTRDIFDIAAIRLDAGQSSPDDRSVEEDRLNFSRAILFRELMIANGDQETPVWATAFGWNADGVNVTREQQAEYVVRGLIRAWSEWPWMGLMIQWGFTTLPGDPDAGYVVAPEGRTTPLYRRLNDPELIVRSDIANTGFTPMEADSLTYSGNWADQHLEGRTFRTTGQTGASVTFEFQGTGLIAFIRSGPQVGDIKIELDGQVVPGTAGDNWSFYYLYQTNDFPRRIFSNLEDERHTVTITLVGQGELTLGGMVVERQPPFIWPIMMVTASGTLVLFLGIRSFIYLVGIRAGHLNRWENVTQPALPRMPDWAPERYR